MHRQNYQDILALVQSPTRYAGNEINAVKKDHGSVDLTFALAFPDLYDIGTSHFGLQILYSILNAHPKIAAERFFAPAPDMEALMVQKQIPCLSLESRTPLADFDIIGISLLYELNFTNILTLLKLSGIPFFSREREDAFPLVIGGGPCAFNPEPLADFFDAFVIGDGETASVKISEAVMQFKKQGDNRKTSLLRILAGIEGVYVPSFFNVSYDEKGVSHTTPVDGMPSSVRRAFLPELSMDLFPISPILPFAKPIHDRLRIEVARGCSRGCRFCQAGMIYRPVRERSLEDLIAITEKSLKATGHSDISLLSLSTGDYSRLPELMTQLMQLSQGHCNAISLPSIRAERLTPELMEIIKKVRKTGFTIAPEAGSQRLRDVINKNLTQKSIESTVENALALGWKNIKLYFMMGLPFETQEDIDAVCRLSRHLASAYAKGKKTINVSMTSFIPKAHTPFQRCAQISAEKATQNLQYLKDHLRHPKINLKWQDPKMSLIEGVWARGDRRLSSLLVAAFENGCRLDGWTDRFDFSLWEKAFEQTGIDPKFYTLRERANVEPLPWDHIDSGVKPEFLKKEFEKAQKQALTPDCRENECTGCGVCDFKRIQPVVNTASATASGPGLPAAAACTAADIPDHWFEKFCISFSKLGRARFFGHLELSTIIQRAIKRAGFPVKYSKGFHPSMRLSFDNALPVGMESEEEVFFIYLDRTLAPETIVSGLNAQLPEGLSVTGCSIVKKGETSPETVSGYRIEFSRACLDENKIDEFLKLDSFIVEDLDKKGRIRKTDIRKPVEMISLSREKIMEMTIRRSGTRTIRPSLVLSAFFKLDDQQIKMAGIRKIKQGQSPC